MRMPQFVRVAGGCHAAAVTLCAAAMTALAPGVGRAADLAGVLGAEAAATATATAPAPDLLPEPAPDPTDLAPAAPATPPAPAGLRFPTRIVLLSGAAADDPRAFIVLGDPSPESAASSAARREAAAAAPAAAQRADRQPADGGATQARPTPPLDRGADPLASTPRIDPSVTGVDAEKILARMLPPRTDGPADWFAPVEPLHFCGEPRLLAPCLPPPPCHPMHPPRLFDLVGRTGTPTCGPIYRGPCAPRSATSHDGFLAPLQRTSDRLFDLFYTPR